MPKDERPKLRRTYRCYGLEDFKKAVTPTGQMLYPYLASKQHEEGGSVGEDSPTYLEGALGLCDSERGGAFQWRSPSPCRCELFRKTPYQRHEVVRFRLPEAWELSRIQISEGLCMLCGKERKLRDLQRVSRRLFEPKQGEDIWEDCTDGSGWDIIGGYQQDGPRILHDEQKEDRGLSELDCKEEMPAPQDLEGILGEFDLDDLYVDARGNEVDEHQPISAERVQPQRLVRVGQDWAWEEYDNNIAAGVLSYLFDSE